ncbi:MAG: hypothetical protein BroJett025_01200 [Patescibacteria group bacterium]|nr:MAG: hypothetical protein BroJett025_01200 [Patescibacteria group bacterium]
MGVFFIFPVEFETKMSRQTIDKPTQTEVHRAYLAPHSLEHWERIQRLVLTGEFGVEPNPQGYSEKLTAPQNVPDFRVTWPNKEKETQDYHLFFEACQMVIGTLHLDDEVFSQSTLPKIFRVLEKSYLYSQLFSKLSISQGNTVRHHVETVPTLVRTTPTDMRERFVLRVTAIFHDVGKAFNIGRDQVHYHALIASNIVSWFMQEYQPQFIHHLYLADKTLVTPVISREEQSVTRESLEVEFTVVRNQITEIIRLHHVLEQIDKGVLDLDVVAQILTEKHINPLSFGLFAIADGSSVIPDNAKYAEFLIKNLDALAKIVDLMEYQEIFQNEGISFEIKKTFAQSLQFAITEVITKVEELPEKVAKIIREIAGKIDTILAVSLLTLV